MGHIHEKIDFCVDVFIVHNNKVLLRLHEKYNKWLSVGGHIELDETPPQAALREVKEEVGLDVELVGQIPDELASKSNSYKELLPPFFLNIHAINEVHQHISLIYFAISKTNKVIPENKTDEWEWLTMEELMEKKDVQETIRYYAKEALLTVSTMAN